VILLLWLTAFAGGSVEGTLYIPRPTGVLLPLVGRAMIGIKL
jgi:hypothetical protein